MGQRAIGVVYNPKYEKYGNYVPTKLSSRYDAILFIDKTNALSPLHMHPIKNDKEPPRDLSIRCVNKMHLFTYTITNQQYHANTRTHTHIHAIDLTGNKHSF